LSVATVCTVVITAVVAAWSGRLEIGPSVKGTRACVHARVGATDSLPNESKAPRAHSKADEHDACRLSVSR
jgi:hypothetical protein